MCRKDLEPVYVLVVVDVEGGVLLEWQPATQQTDLCLCLPLLSIPTCDIKFRLRATFAHECAWRLKIDVAAPNPPSWRFESEVFPTTLLDLRELGSGNQNPEGMTGTPTLEDASPPTGPKSSRVLYHVRCIPWRARIK